MGHTQCTLKVARPARVWKFVSLFLPLLALGHIGHSYAAVQFANLGENSTDITFSRVPVSGSYDGTTVITQMTQTGPAITNPADFSFSSYSWGPTEAMRVDFTSPVSFVFVYFLPNDPDTGVLQVYSAEGTLLGEQVGRDSIPFTLSFNTSSTPYAYILASYGDAGYLGHIGYEVAAVPEPETYAMMLTGLGLVGFMTSRRKAA